MRRTNGELARVTLISRGSYRASIEACSYDRFWAACCPPRSRCRSGLRETSSDRLVREAALASMTKARRSMHLVEHRTHWRRRRRRQGRRDTEVLLRKQRFAAILDGASRFKFTL